MTESASSATPAGGSAAVAGTGLPAEELAALDADRVEARSLPASPVSAAEVRAAGLRLDDLWLPAVVLHEDALRHNLDRFARWCSEHGAELAPHGKTTMSPHLWSAQLDRGAWALTAATVAQARVMRRFGASRVLIANEVVEPGQLAWLAEALDDPDFTPMCLVDSEAQAAAMETALAAAPRPLPVLVEIGVAGRRTGVRDPGDALALARRVAASARLRLAGVEGYEGVFPQRRDGDAPERARAWLDALAEFAARADSEGLFAAVEEIVVTAGGSAYPDLAADALAAVPALSRPLRPVIRSGCYLTHDDLFMERASPLRSAADPAPLRPALTCYARVLSCPEPGRALLGAGKRDVSFDIDLPRPRAVLRDGRRTAVGEGVRVVELNDHHAFLDVAESAGDAVPQVGDVVELGLSHPCTVFDKWPLIPVLDSRRRVVDAVRTLF
ncbi:alanine racemase [Streptomonospora litoralis]|uniref:D-threonine aldolase n=1 Tax=Streptomonospora litoralis TaxID=2498135 RepID=A0A4P6Q842_9ACTN|nr:alanine racemase [Streptomonospora litoralis]QBI55194.1 D-threonine aldolase [Streptomonospora litoralis]